MERCASCGRTIQGGKEITITPDLPPLPKKIRETSQVRDVIDFLMALDLPREDTIRQTIETELGADTKWGPSIPYQIIDVLAKQLTSLIRPLANHYGTTSEMKFDAWAADVVENLEDDFGR